MCRISMADDIRDRVRNAQPCACTGRKGRRSLRDVRKQSLPESFIAREVKELVLLNRPAERAAELFVLDRILCGGSRERIASIQRRSAAVSVRIAVHAVRAGLQTNV